MSSFDVAERLFRQTKLGIELQRSFEISLRPLEITLFKVGSAPVEEGVRIFRIEFDCLVIIGDGAVEIAFCLIDYATIDMR